MLRPVINKKYDWGQLTHYIFLEICLLLFGSTNVYSQLNASFEIQDSICFNQDLKIKNISSEGTNYLWDFCFDALGNETIISEVTEVGSANVEVGIIARNFC